MVQAEAEVRFLIQQHRAAWLELESSKLQCCLEATPRGPLKPRRAPAAPLQPPALPLLQGTASSLLAGPAAYLQDVALNGGAQLEGDAGPPQKGPSGLPPHPTPNLISGQGTAESWEGAGLGNPLPPPLPSRRRRGLVLTAPCRLQGARMAGRPVGCPPPLWRRWGKTTTSPSRIGRRVQRRSAGSQGPPQGCHRGPAGRGRAGPGRGHWATAMGAHGASREAKAVGGPVRGSH